MTDTIPSALAGLKVLDLSRILAGPWSAQVMADLGADVIKVESPNGGDDTRGWGPPFMHDGEGNRTDAAYFAACNRNKRSVAIDFSKPEGAELVKTLARKSDVLVENFKLNGLKKYGLDYQSIRQINPGIIYCSITGFGQSGPYAHRAGYDFLIQGMGAIMSITGQPDGVPGAEPLKVGVAICDLFTGMYASTSILAALNHRHKTGEGQHIDAALMDSQIAMLANQASNWLNGAMVPGRMGNNHPNIAPYRVFEVSDGFVIVACGNDAQFRRLVTVLGSPELADDPRFFNNESRVKNRDTTDGEIQKRLLDKNRGEVISLLESVSVPCGPINNIPEVFNDPQVQARGLQVDLERGDGTTISGVGFPAKLSATPARYHSAPPELADSTREVLEQWAELDVDTVARLADQGIIK